MTLRDRADAYSRAFPDRPPLQVVTEGTGTHRREVVYGQWCIGADYRNKTRYYGAYPAGYLERVMALFPDVLETPRPKQEILHVFSGSLPPGEYLRCDSHQPSDFRTSVYDLPEDFRRRGRPSFALVLADPPYSADDAKKYGTPMIHRGRTLAALAEVTRPGGHLVWLDTTWPMHRKDQWVTVGRIGLVRSTNHRVRMVSIFERRAA